MNAHAKPDRALTVAVVVLLVMLFLLAQRAPSLLAQPVPFTALVREYRQGDMVAAVRAFEEWPRQRLRELVETTKRVERDIRDRDLPALSPDSNATLASVVMLHTEAALHGIGTREHLTLASYPLSRLARRADATKFVQSWRIVVASWMLFRGEYVEAADLAGAGQSGGELLLLQGAIAEGKVLLVGSSNRRTGFVAAIGSRREDSWVLLAEAEQKYRAALSDDPTLVEARVRLGRVLALQGKREAALQVLSEARAMISGGFLAYLAALFEGRLHEAAGRFEAARQCYETAVNEYPEAQAAYVALGHLLESSGRLDPRSTTIEQMFTRGPERDPWWVYPYAQLWQTDARLAALRGFAREP